MSTVTLNPSGNLPGGHLVYDDSNNSLTLDTTDIANAGVHSLLYEVTLTGYDYTISSTPLPFTVEFVDLCGTYVPTMTNADDNSHTDPYDYYYTGVKEVFEVTQT